MRALMRVVPLASLILSGCASSFDVYHVPRNCDGCSNKFGKHVLFYALPETVVTVDAVVEKKIVEDGPCKDKVTEDFLRVPPKDYFGSGPTESKTKVTSATIGSRAEPDPDRVYAIKLSKRWYQKVSSSFSLSEAGVLTSAEMTSENQAVDFAVTTLKTVAGIAVKAGIGVGAPATDATPGTEKCKEFKDEIDKLRDVRRQIIHGQLSPSFPQEGPAITVLLEKIAQAEAELAAKFIGAATVTTGTVHCEVNPQDDKYNLDQELFKIAKDGVDSANGPCRVPSDLNSKMRGDKTVSLKLATDRGQQLAGIAASTNLTRPDPSGLVFRIPATSAIEVLVDKDSKAFDLRPVAQFGLVTALPRSADVSTFQSTVKAALYPATGAIQKLDYSGTPQGTGAITGIGEAAGTVLDARAAKRKEEAAAKDELAQLERMRKILEERKKIIDLGGNPDEVP
jgi:hypothetical protein